MSPSKPPAWAEALVDTFKTVSDSTITQLAVVAQKVESLDKKVCDLDTAVNGNGKAGLKTDLAVLQNDVKALKNEKKQRVGIYVSVALMLLSTVLSWILK